MENKSLGKNAVYNIIYRVLNVIFPLISTAYISRVLLADGVGRVSAVNNNVSYFLILATLGIPAYGLREISKNKGNNEERSKVYSELFALNSFLTVTTYVLFSIIVYYSSCFQYDKFLYEIYGLTILINVVNVDWFFQGVEEYGFIAARSTIIKAVSLVALFILVRDKNDIYLYAIIQVVSLSGNYAFSILKTRNYVTYNFKQINYKRHIKSLMYLALCSVSTELYAKMDITMLDIMKSNEVVGYYANSQRIVNLVVTVLIAATAVYMPRLSYLFEENKLEFNRILKNGFELILTVSIPAWIGLIAISQPLVISFLGNDFFKATVTVSILSFMIPLKCVGDLICYQVMMCAQQEVLLMKSYFITMVVNLVNNLFLIPRFGAEGAAVASVISEILAFLFVFWFSRKYICIRLEKGVIFKTVLCTGIMACVIFPMNLLACSYYLKLILETGVGVWAYILSCITTKHSVVLQSIQLLETKIRR